MITNKQSGFRPGDSTTNQLIDLVNEICKSFDHRNYYETRSIFLDISTCGMKDSCSNYSKME